MLGTHLNIETFMNDCTKFDESKQALLTEHKNKCKLLEGKNHYNIDYKQARETLFSLYKEFYTLCTGDKEAIIKALRVNINETNELNLEKKSKLDGLKKIIDDQNKDIVSIDKEIEKHKHYDAVKQHRILGSESLRKRSFTEYYIYIVLIIVFVIIQIILLVF